MIALYHNSRVDQFRPRISLRFNYRTLYFLQTPVTTRFFNSQRQRDKYYDDHSWLWGRPVIKGRVKYKS